MNPCTPLPRGRHLSVIAEDVPFPNRIRELRLAARLSQRQLGYLIDMSQSQLGAIERGMFRPTQRILERLAEHLHCQTWHIFYETSQEDHDRLIQSFNRLLPSQRLDVLTMMDGLHRFNAAADRPRKRRPRPPGVKKSSRNVRAD